MPGLLPIDRWDLREAQWLDRGRVRAYSILLGIASLAIMVPFYLQAISPVGTDFLAFWGAGKVTAAGHPADAYDLAVQQQVQQATGSDGWFAFVNPPPFLFVVAPFGLLPFRLAWIVWVAATYAVWAAVSLRQFPRLRLPILVFPAALVAAGHAQNGFVTGALLVAGVSQLERRPWLAGALLGALVIKPHLALLVPFWLAAGGRWSAFVAAGLSALALLAASCAVFGLDILPAYATSWDASAQLMQMDKADFFLRMSTAYGQLRVFGSPQLALAVQGAITAAMLVLAVLSWRRFPGDALATGALMLACTGLASPYLFNYDLPFLVLPLMWLVREGLQCGFRPYERLGLVALYAAPFATRAIALPLHFNLMPFALAALIWLIWTRGARRETPAAAA